MALSTNIYAEVVTQFPASVEGSGGITVTKSGGVYTITFAGSGIAVNSIGNDKLAQVAGQRLIGNPTGATADRSEISLGSDLEFSGTSLQGAAFTGDMTKAAGGTATTIPNNTVTFAKMQDIATDSLVGRDTAGSGDPEAIGLNATLEMDGSSNLRRAALTGDVTAPAGSNATTIPANTITLAKMATQADGTILSNISGGVAVPSANGISAVLDDLLGTTRGSVIYRGASAWSALAPGTSGRFLKTLGAGADPAWDTPTASATAPEMIHVRDEKANTTVGGASVSGQQTRTLNTVVTNTLTGASLASNKVTLAAGTYDVEASAPGHGVGVHKIRLRNDTDSTTILVGTSEYCVVNVQNRSFLKGRFTLAAQKDVLLQHYTFSVVATNGLGVNTSTGDVEVYADLKITEVP